MSAADSVTRDAILADPRSSLPLLHQFLGAYLHEDWAVDSPRWTDAVDAFLAGASPATVVGTVAELRHLAGAGFDATTLQQVLLDLDSGIDPRGVGLDADAWLEAVIRQLEG